MFKGVNPKHLVFVISDMRVHQGSTDVQSRRWWSRDKRQDQDVNLKTVKDVVSGCHAQARAPRQT